MIPDSLIPRGGEVDRSQPSPSAPAPARSSRPGRAPAQHRSRRTSVMRGAAAAFFGQQALSLASKQTFDDDGRLTPGAESFLTRAVTVQRPLVMANLRHLRKNHPTLTNRQLAHQLDKEFSRVMTGTGAAIGATAAIPTVGTVASLGLSAVATGGFLETCALYAQSVAELSGVSTEDPQRAQLLVMGIMLGEEGRQLLGELSEQVGGRGLGPVSTLVPMRTLASSSSMGGLVVNQIKRQFVRRFFLRQGTTMVARAIPFGIGAVVGGAANQMLARQIIRTAHRTFGELPEETPQSLVEDMRHALEREKHRADRRERRRKKKSLRAERRTVQKERRGDRSERRRELRLERARRRIERAETTLQKAQAEESG
ncbi:hypothetical protein [Nesterenkonia xinjiangensis]|uniref:EcsC protein family protein n=1 Tax=Nesterenkonia xinjiangensis TaxID=225327 RepID=A0A7Z0K9Z2_9MICC|nr:hypothetical protein [Nesterenkonia xinjiangensis]NYJ78288.1 hypothetical protein [Nesterenkonia xinjiangensis]